MSRFDMVFSIGLWLCEVVGGLTIGIVIGWLIGSLIRGA